MQSKRYFNFTTYKSCNYQNEIYIISNLCSEGGLTVSECAQLIANLFDFMWYFCPV